MFLRLATQWTIAGTMTGSTYIGLRYEAVIALLDLYEVPERKAMMEDLQIIERGALAAFRERD